MMRQKVGRLSQGMAFNCVERVKFYATQLPQEWRNNTWRHEQSCSKSPCFFFVSLGNPSMFLRVGVLQVFHPDFIHISFIFPEFSRK